MTIGSEFGEAGAGVVGATGGSGTRAIARILRNGGMYIGTQLNESEDAVEFGEYSDLWINAFLFSREAGMPDWLNVVMREHLRRVLSSHCEGVRAEQKWGWKEPRSIFLLPLLHEALPKLRFLHVVRDGRDMAFSANQNQLRKHGGAYLARSTDPTSPLDSIELWARLNLETARFGVERLGDRYLRIRFEDLCADPVVVAEALFSFFELTGDPQIAANEVNPPEAVARWRTEDPGMVRQLEEATQDALGEFGYIAD